MTIQEAIKSGKRRKLPEWDKWHNPGEDYFYSDREVMREDWEIEQVPREIWVGIFKNGNYSSITFDDKKKCEQYCNEFTEAGTAIKFREVIE